MDLEKIVRTIPAVDLAKEIWDEKDLARGVRNHHRNNLAKNPITKKKFDNQLKYEDYQEKSKELILDTEFYMRKIDQNINSKLKDLKKYRNNIHKTLFVRASELTEKIVVKDFKNDIKLQKVRYDLEKYAPGNILLCDSKEIKDSIKLTSVVLFAHVDLPAFLLTRSNLKSNRELYKAEAEYERVKAECQRIKAKYARKKATAVALENTNKVIEALSNMLQKSEDNVEEIILKKGKKINTWNDEEISAVRTMFNLLGVLSDILHTDPFTKNGNLTTAYKKLIGDVQGEYLGVANE